MADDNRLKAETRTSFGKGAARKIRAAHKIPAVIYGHGTEPVHITLPGHETALIIRRANAVLDLDIDGKAQLALVKDVQKDPVRQIIEHMDLIVVRRGEKVTVDVPVVIEGESAPETLATLEANTVSIEVEATHIPERLTASIEGLEAGTQVLASQLELPKGATLVADPETIVVAVTVPSTDAELEEIAEADAEVAEAQSEEAEAEASSDDADAAEGDADKE